MKDQNCQFVCFSYSRDFARYPRRSTVSGLSEEKEQFRLSNSVVDIAAAVVVVVVVVVVDAVVR